MRPAVTRTSQLYRLIDDTLVTSLRLFTRGFSKCVVLKKKRLLKFVMKKLWLFAFHFPESFSSEVDFFNRRVIKNRLFHLARGKP